MKLSPAESIEWIKSRKSVYPKMFDPEATVNEQEVMELFEAARWAPNHKLTQPWRFVAFIDGGLEELTMKQIDLIQAAEFELELARNKIKKLKDKARNSVAIVAIIMRRDEQLRVPEWEEMCAVACAVQNVALHSTALNLVGYWSTGSFTNAAEIRQFLGLEQNDVHLGWYYLGRPISATINKRIRKVREEFVEIRRC